MSSFPAFIFMSCCPQTCPHLQLRVRQGRPCPTITTCWPWCGPGSSRDGSGPKNRGTRFPSRQPPHLSQLSLPDIRSLTQHVFADPPLCPEDGTWLHHVTSVLVGLQTVGSGVGRGSPPGHQEGHREEWAFDWI